jgi:hypothetical protein
MYRKWAIERLRFPRVAFSRFFLGRLLGEPGRPDRQHMVIRDALGLFSAEAPVHIDLPYRWHRT